MNIKILLSSILLTYSGQNMAQKLSTVCGQFESGKAGDTVYLESSEGIKYSSVIYSDNYFKFTFVLNISDVYFIRYPSLSNDFMFPVFVKEGSKIIIQINNELDNFKFTGDKTAEEQNNFYSGLKSRYDAYTKIKQQTDTITNSSENAELLKKLEFFKKDYEDYYINWVKNHNESPFSPAVINLFIHNGFPNDTIAAKYFNLLSETAKYNNYQARRLASKLAQINDSFSLIPINSKAPDFSISDTLGNKIKLKDFKGKYLLIDFWASWCSPCRANNPLLKTIYNKYKGLELLSISVDKEVDAWKNAILKDGMNWTNGSDLKFYSNKSVAFNYGVYGVPYYVLIDPLQNIIFKSEGGDIQKTMQKLEEVLGH